MKVTAYCRVSTDSETQESSLQNQISYFQREITAKGFEYFPLFYDEGLTGTQLTNRPGFIKMLQCAGIDYVVHTDYNNNCRQTRHFELSSREPQFEAIWIKNTSRFARNIEGLTILDMLKTKGVYVYFLEQNLNTKDNSDLLISIFSVLDKQESIDKSNRVIWGYREKAKQGKIITNGKLFGYDYLPKPDERLVKNEKESEIVSTIFQLYSEGLGIRTIIKYLTEHNMYTRQGKPFGKTTINRILDNEKYCGINNNLKYDRGKIFAKHSLKIRDEYGQEYSSNIEPIIPKELFEKCQQIKQSKINYKHNAGKYNGKTKYAGLLYCGVCGNVYNGNADRGRRFYNCKGKKTQGIKYCNGKNISEIKLDEYIQWLVNGGLDTIIQGNIFYLTALAKVIVLEKLKHYNAQDNDRARQLQDDLAYEKKVLANYYQLLARATADTDSLQNLVTAQEIKVQALQVQVNESLKDNEEIKKDIRELTADITESEMQLKQIHKHKLTADNIRDVLDKVFVYYLPKDYFTNNQQGQYSLYKLQFSKSEHIESDIYILTVDKLTAGLTTVIQAMRGKITSKHIISKYNIPFDKSQLTDKALVTDLQYIDNALSRAIKSMHINDNKQLRNIFKYADKVEQDKASLINKANNI